jgi:hypothetical protein
VKTGVKGFRGLGIAALAAVIVAACATAPSSGGAPRTAGGEPVPEWFEDPKSVYPDDEYLSAIGSGDTRRGAEQDALSSLSQIFEARVSVDQRTSERYRELARESGTLTESDIQLATTVNVQSDQRLVNVQYGESFTDDQGRVHVIAYMDRLETGTVYRNLIQKNAGQIDRFLTEAEQTDGIIRRFAFISAAHLVAQNNRALIDQLQIISTPLARTLELPYDEQRVAERRAEIASQMAYRIEISGGAASRVAEVVGEALSQEGFVVSDSGPLLVRGSGELEPSEGGRYEEVRWYLNLEFVGPEGAVLVAYSQQDRASGVSQDAARSFAFSDMEEVAKEEFVGQIIDYFDGLVIQ